MPQPAFSLASYLETPLPALKTEYPIGQASKVAKDSWSGALATISVIDGFQKLVSSYLEDKLPEAAIPAHPLHPYPHLQTLARNVALNSEADLVRALKTLPLEALLAVLSAWDLEEDHAQEEAGKVRVPVEADAQSSISGPGGERVAWRFGKSPLGETEFLLVDGDGKAQLVVRSAMSSVFTKEDWQEFSVTGNYRYNNKSKASVYWSRLAGGTQRVGVRHFVLTSFDTFVFGIFSEDYTYANVSPVLQFNDKAPSVLAALTYWGRSALGHPGTYTTAEKRDVSGEAHLFPTNPARRASMNQGARPLPARRLVPKLAAESDVEDEDAA